MSFITRHYGIVAIFTSIGIATLVTGCGQRPTSSEKPSSQKPRSPREEALATYLEVQKSIAEGNFDQFKQHLAPEFTAAANSGALTPEFQRLTVEYGGNLAKFFGGNAEFQLDDEEGRIIRIDEIFQYKTRLVQKWPNMELLAKVDDICTVGEAGFVEEDIKNLAKKFKDEMVALAVKEGEDAATIEKEWDAMSPHRLLEAISHHVQDLCEFAEDGSDASRPQQPRFRIDITRLGDNAPRNATSMRFSFYNDENDEEVGQEFILHKFDDGMWKIVRNP